MKRTPHQRRTPLARTGPLKRSRPTVKQALHASINDPAYSYPCFLAAVLEAWEGTTCWLCDLRPEERERCREASAGFIPDAHHICSKQLLKREGLHAHLMDARNGVPLRRWHHDRWERGFTVPARHELPPAVEQFAGDLALTWFLDRSFKDERQAA